MRCPCGPGALTALRATKEDSRGARRASVAPRPSLRTPTQGPPCLAPPLPSPAGVSQTGLAAALRLVRAAADVSRGRRSARGAHAGGQRRRRRARRRPLVATVWPPLRLRPRRRRAAQPITKPHHPTKGTMALPPRRRRPVVVAAAAAAAAAATTIAVAATDVAADCVAVLNVTSFYPLMRLKVVRYAGCRPSPPRPAPA